MTNEALLKFEAALIHPNFARVTSGHPVSPDRVNVYHSNPRSPTGVMAVASILPETEDERRQVREAVTRVKHATYRGGLGSPFNK